MIKAMAFMFAVLAVLVVATARVQGATDEPVATEYVDLGVFEMTYYCYGSKTATGTKPIPYVTVAVDPKVIPLGSLVMVGFTVDGVTEWITCVASDTGGVIKGKIIDLYIGDGKVDEAKQRGRDKVQVRIVKRNTAPM